MAGGEISGCDAGPIEEEEPTELPSVQVIQLYKMSYIL